MFNPQMDHSLAYERRRELLETAASARIAGTLRGGRRHRISTWVNRTFRSTVR